MPNRLVNIISRFGIFRGNARVTSLVTKAVAEAARVAVSAGLVAAGSPIAGQFLGTVAKDVIEKLLARTTAVEQKLDKLLREPLFSGLQLLCEASRHAVLSQDQVASRDDLLDLAHLSFVRAHTLVADSRQDSVFIRSLDCIALASRTGRLSVAEDTLIGVQRDIDELRARVEALEGDAKDWQADVQLIRAFLGRDDLGTKSFGYDAWSSRQEKHAAKSRLLAQQAREELDRLNSFVELAYLAVKGRNKASSSEFRVSSFELRPKTKDQSPESKL